VNLLMLWCGNILLLTIRFFDVAKFYILTLISLLISCKHSFPIVDLKISSLSTLALNVRNRCIKYFSSKLNYNVTLFLRIPV
jgi:hypothetical protein